MPTPSHITLLALAVPALAACQNSPQALTTEPPAAPPTTSASAPVGPVSIQADPATPRPPFRFSADEQRLLDEIQHACFSYFWDAKGPHGQTATGMIPDRSSIATVSVAGVGFQLSAFVVGVERGYVTRQEAHDRTLRILRALASGKNLRKHGMFYHFIDGDSGEHPDTKIEDVVSTVDSALLFAGVLTVSQYFGGEVQRAADQLFADADWTAFTLPGTEKLHEKGFLSLGWKPNDPRQPTGEGAILPFGWIDSGDEHRLTTFLAVCAPDASHRLDPAMYYKLRRGLGVAPDGRPLVFFPWSGALFTAFFAHCWMPYVHWGPDDPLALGVEHRARVDWWENSRRHMQLHIDKAALNPERTPTLSRDAWGLSASDAAHGYAVPGLFPTPLDTPGARPELDFPTYRAKDKWGDGTVAPYAAGSCIMFDKAAPLAALRYYRDLKGADARPLVWRDVAAGGYGFLDAFNLRNGSGNRAEPWVAPDYIAIDQGPLLLAIENARTGLIWRVFQDHPAVRAGMERLKIKPK